jgi:hypothetical protein
MSWTAAEQQAIDRVHRIGQDEPVAPGGPRRPDHRQQDRRAHRQQGLAARALDGSDQEVGSGDSVQLDALIHLLRQALTGR